jgi:uncharacterized protein
VVFKRRNRRSVLQVLREFLWPRGGWARAATYVTHRLRRLPDDPHRIARGVFAGVFASFTPFFGFHWILAGLIAWASRGNILAALLATFAGNPLTTPLVAWGSVELGHWMLGDPVGMPLREIFGAFSHAGAELWANFKAIFSADVTHWYRLGHFFRSIFLPYMVGGIIPGLVVSLVFYYASIPVVRGYQKLRAVKLKERIERARAAKAARTEADRGAMQRKVDQT